MQVNALTIHDFSETTHELPGERKVVQMTPKTQKLPVSPSLLSLGSLRTPASQ